ncbi:hypothetical protein ACFE04_009590 [Oxalis oulophora]
MSTARGKTMRSKVESRMRKESGKTLKEIRRAKKLKLKLMDDNERLVYNLKRNFSSNSMFYIWIATAKKKVALLLQKLKKYELPELPTSVHDPELFTPEQIQAFKKIGYKNKNYVPVGIRGVFGGVVQNMHMHWKFHETVQVCCDNFPKEKIKEMATMIARLSGGIVINIHNTKTIIMFRGRNYRQPKNLIPFNTLTKRKALFKARFEQALESQKLNIKKTEQQLRKKGISPDDPVAMASIQRVASTFFNAIDKKEGSPYVFQSDKLSVGAYSNIEELEEPPMDSDQEELDEFIAEIEQKADEEWEAEEEAEKEELGQIRYLNREDYGGRFRRSGNDDDSESEIRESRGWKDNTRGRRTSEYNNESEDGESDSDNASDPDVETNYPRRPSNGFRQHGREQGKHVNPRRGSDDRGFDRREQGKPVNPRRGNDDRGFDRREQGKTVNPMRGNDDRGFDRNRQIKGKKDEASESENMISDVENALWESGDDEDEDEDDLPTYSQSRGSPVKKGHIEFDSESDNEAMNPILGLDGDEGSHIGRYNNWESSEEENQQKNGSSETNPKKEKSRKEVDEKWDSD